MTAGFQQLISNGCSYMQYYADGQGHRDLADRLGIPRAMSLARYGTSNDRMIRTTIQHALHARDPNFYLLGVTFISRMDYPVLAHYSEEDGPWVSMQSNIPGGLALDDQLISERDVRQLFDIKQKFVIQNGRWLFEEFCLRLVSMIDFLKYRGHQCLAFMNADNLHLQWCDHPRLSFLQSYPEIVDGLKWLAIAYQHERGVPAVEDDRTPPDCRHRMGGHHKVLNDFIMDYITANHERYQDLLIKHV